MTLYVWPTHTIHIEPDHFLKEMEIGFPVHEKVDDPNDDATDGGTSKEDQK